MSEAPANPADLSVQTNVRQPGVSDERLMVAFTQGSSEAFTELFYRYKQPVYGFFCRRVSDPTSAQACFSQIRNNDIVNSGTLS